MPKSSGMRRIVATHRHLRESQGLRMAMFLSLDRSQGVRDGQGLYQPHTDKATVPRTGTLPPLSCGKGPKAAGESVMVLPGSSRHTAVRLTSKGSDRMSWKGAARVVRGWESQPQGERRQSKELRGESPNGGVSTPALNGTAQTPPRNVKVSVRTALEGKPGALKGACPVWRGALGNLPVERLTRRLASIPYTPLHCHYLTAEVISTFPLRGKAYFPDALYLVVELVAFQLLLQANMRKHAIALSLPDIEGLPVSRVNESVNVGLEPECYLCRK
jgi:hypothetical protein